MIYSKHHGCSAREVYQYINCCRQQVLENLTGLNLTCCKWTKILLSWIQMEIM